MEATLDILEGAFRYTSDKLNTAWQRDVRINLGSTATVGIRGTDLWGKVGPEQQFVVLLEGQIELTDRAAGDKVALNTPLQIYQAAEKSVGTVEMAQVQALAPETELDFGAGVQSLQGGFQLNLASFDNEKLARAEAKRVSEQGLAADVNGVRINGDQWFRVSVNRLASLDDARALMSRVKKQFGYQTPWISGS